MYDRTCADSSGKSTELFPSANGPKSSDWKLKYACILCATTALEEEVCENVDNSRVDCALEREVGNSEVRHRNRDKRMEMLLDLACVTCEQDTKKQH